MDLQLTLRRALRILLLDPTASRGAVRSEAETLPALVVVVAASYLAGLGGLVWTLTAATDADVAAFFLRSFLFGSALQVGAFLLWVGASLYILRGVYHLQIAYAELLRAIGYAFSPIALQLLIFIPAIDQPIGIIALAATLYVATAAVQQATTASAGQAFTACLFGFAIFCLLLGILGNGSLDLAPGIFALDPNSLSVGTTLHLTNVKR